MKAERIVWWIILAFLIPGAALALAGTTAWLPLPTPP